MTFGHEGGHAFNEDQRGGHDEIGACLGALRGPIERGETQDREFSLRLIARVEAEVAKLRRQIEGHCGRIVGQSELLTRRAEGAQQPGHWTKQLPTRDGWYWWRINPDESRSYVVEVHLSKVYNTGLADVPWVEELMRFHPDSEWCGPLPEPGIGAVTPDVVRDAEIRGVRGGLEESAKAIDGERATWPSATSNVLETVTRDTLKALANHLRAIDPASVAVGGPE